MKTIAVNCLKYTGTFIVLILIFNICLYLACLFDSQRIKANIIESYEILHKQGAVYYVSEVFSVQNDNNTDALMINELYSVDCHQPFGSYMKVRKNYSPGLTKHEKPDVNGECVSVLFDEKTNSELITCDLYDPIKELGDFLHECLHTAIDYGRYWHGYFILYRPLLLICNISQIRALLFTLFVGLYLYFVYLLHRRFGKTIAVILGMSLACSGYFTAYCSLSNAITFVVMMVGAIVLLRRIDRIKDFSLFLFVIACVANFFDYLTVPLISLGMLCGLYLLKLLEEGKDWYYCLKFVVLNTVIWLFGFSSTWLCKWIMYDLTMHDGNSMLMVGLNQCIYRMNRTNTYAEIFGDKGVFITMLIIGRASFYTLITAGVVIYLQEFRINIRAFDKRALPFMLLALFPVIWYTALANHTVMHYFYTYRQSFIFMLGVLLAIYEMLWPMDKDAPKPVETSTAESSKSGSAVDDV